MNSRAFEIEQNLVEAEIQVSHFTEKRTNFLCHRDIKSSQNIARRGEEVKKNLQKIKKKNISESISKTERQGCANDDRSTLLISTDGDNSKKKTFILFNIDIIFKKTVLNVCLRLKHNLTLIYFIFLLKCPQKTSTTD